MERDKLGRILPGQGSGWKCDHPRTPENTWRKKYKRNGDRVVEFDACRTCQRERVNRWRADPINRARDIMGKELRRDRRTTAKSRKRELTRVFGPDKRLLTDTNGGTKCPQT